MEDKIKKIEKQLIEPKEWKYMGEVDIYKRPKDSLLTQQKIEFEQASTLVPFSTKMNGEFEKITYRRLKERAFDNYVFSANKEIEMVEEVYETKELDKIEIVKIYNEIESELLKIADFGNFGFVPDVEIRVIKEDVVERKVNAKKFLDKSRNVTFIKK